jgi:hypothetical protein
MVIYVLSVVDEVVDLRVTADCCGTWWYLLWDVELQTYADLRSIYTEAYPKLGGESRHISTDCDGDPATAKTALVKV